MGNRQQAPSGRWVGLILFTAALGLAAIPAIWSAVLVRPADKLPVADAERILGSMVQLELFAPAPDSGAAADGKTRYMLGRGQGTLVAGTGGTWLLTHNHWGTVLTNLAFARLYDARHLLLAELPGAEFKALIQVSDAGTLILRAPASLGRLTAAELQPPGQARPGDRIWVTRHDPADPNRLVVLAATVQSPRTFQGHAVMAVQTDTGEPLLPGDSGGGVWHAGILVGNLWATELQAASAAPISTGPAAGERGYTDVSYVAPLSDSVRNMLLDGTLAGLSMGAADPAVQHGGDRLQP